MAIRVTNEYGTFEYSPTKLEMLVNELASQWGVQLPDLNPCPKPYSAKLFLRKEIDRRMEDSEIYIVYNKNPSKTLFREAVMNLKPEVDSSFSYPDEDWHKLYAEDNVGSEGATLRKGDKAVDITLNLKEAIIIITDTRTHNIVINRAIELLTKNPDAKKYTLGVNKTVPICYGGVKLTFNMDPETNRNTAINFVRNYFSNY